MGIYESNVKEVGRLDQGLRPPDVVSAKRAHLTGYLQGAWSHGQTPFQTQAKHRTPHPSRDQAMSMLPASVNLTALSVNSSTQWLHRGGAVCSTCRLNFQTSCWPGRSSWPANTHPSPTNSTFLSSYRPCDGGVLLGKSNTNKTTT